MSPKLFEYLRENVDRPLKTLGQLLALLADSFDIFLGNSSLFLGRFDEHASLFLSLGDNSLRLGTGVVEEGWL